MSRLKGTRESTSTRGDGAIPNGAKLPRTAAKRKAFCGKIKSPAIRRGRELRVLKNLESASFRRQRRTCGEAYQRLQPDRFRASPTCPAQESEDWCCRPGCVRCLGKAVH